MGVLHGGLRVVLWVWSVCYLWSIGCVKGEEPTTYFTKLEGYHCGGADGWADDLLRDWPGNATECQAKCIELGVECAGFVRVKGGSNPNHIGNCYFRNHTLTDIQISEGNYRDCFVRTPFPPPPEPTDWTKLEGYHCGGADGWADDLLRDFAGNATECQAKCVELGVECVGFVRVKGGSNPNHIGNCYFRNHTLTDIQISEGNYRDCFVRNALTFYSLDSDIDETTDSLRNPVGPWKGKRVDIEPTEWTVAITAKDLAILVLVVINLIAAVALCFMCGQSKAYGRRRAYKVVSVAGDSASEQVGFVAQ